MSKQIYAQPSLFRRQKSEENTISYTPGPNPDLGRFVAEQATPYDPTGDDYNVPPFDKPITAKKNTKVFNMHSYHQGRKAHDAIQQYIRHYTQQGDIVLDCFSGSGGTALAALLEGRKAIAIDLSPASTFITKNYCSPVEVSQLQHEFESMKAKLKPEMDWLYETRCDRCDGRATTAFTVYSYVFQCPRCLEKFPLIDCVEAQGQTKKGKPKTIQACPYCFERGHVEEISTRAERFDPIPVIVNYLCLDGCKPQRDQRLHNDPNAKKRDYFQKYDLGKLREIETKRIPYWFPTERMMNVESDTIPWGDKWRSGTSNFRTVAELYTKRNLWALAAWMHVANTQNDDRIRFAISSLALGLSQMCRYDPRWSFPYPLVSGTYYLPQISKEMNAYRGIISKVEKTLSSGWKIIADDLSDLSAIPPVLISTQSATSLSDIPSNTVDYIFTDPPYGDNVQYGELNFVWEAWLGFAPSWHEQEIIVNKTRSKTDHDWAKMMFLAMKECHRILKPGRWLSLCYHDTSEGTWQLMQDLMTEAGFIPENIDATLYIETNLKSFNQLIAEKVTKRDLVINFRKPRLDELPQQLTLLGEEDAATFTEKARAILREALEAHPGSPADRLYDELVSRMVRQRTFERHNFDELLRSVAEEVDGRWYLLETAGQVDAAESAKEEAAASRLETFMQTYLSENPSETGIHFSDLFEQNLYVQDKPRRDLKEWLPEFFFRTEAGIWRPPANEEEREQKAALRSTGTLRRIKRFGNALLEGVPPAERDRPENVATAGSWIRQCRRAGLYEIGRALYEKGGFNFADLSDEDRLEVEEDYQICVRRSS